MDDRTTAQETIRLRLFGLRGAGKSRIEKEVYPFAANLTVSDVWEGLKRQAEPGSVLATLSNDKVLALVNGTPIQRLAEWESTLEAGDTITFMAKAFGG
jgi:molybdopterin converting factor small subunit